MFINPCPVCGERANRAVAVGHFEESFDGSRACVLPKGRADEIDRQKSGGDGIGRGEVLLIIHG